MNKMNRIQRTSIFGMIAGTLLMLTPSCIDQLYDLEHGISKDIALGGDSLSFPIGSTDTIRLGDYLNQDELDILRTMEDGSYALTLKDSIDPVTFSIDTTSLNLADQRIQTSIDVDFGNLNLSNLKIPGISVADTVGLGLGNYTLGGFSIENPTKQTSANAGLADFKLGNATIEDTDVSANVTDVLSGINLPPNPGGFEPVLLPIENGNVNIDESSLFSNSFTVPEGITNISDVKLASGAYLEIRIQLSDASTTLSSGTLLPNLTINTDGLFQFENSAINNQIPIGTADSLCKSGNYQIVKRYNLTGLNTPSNPVGDKMIISKTFTTTGTMSFVDGSVMSDKLNEVQNMDLNVTMSIKNIQVASMSFNIPTIKMRIPSQSIPIELNSTIPKPIMGINRVLFNDPAFLKLDVNSSGLEDIDGLNIQIDTIRMSFPNTFAFADGAPVTNHIYLMKDKAYTQGSFDPIQLNLKELNMASIPINNETLSWSDQVGYEAVVSLTGRLNSAQIPTTDPTFQIDLTSNLSINSAEVQTDTLTRQLDLMTIPIHLSLNISNMVKKINKIEFSDPSNLVLTLNRLNLPLDLDSYFTISFPEIFVFNPPLKNNTYVINGEIPESITLNLKELNLENEIIDLNGGLDLRKQIQLDGFTTLQSGTVNSKSLETLGDKKIIFNASTSELKVSNASVELNSLGVDFSDSTVIDIEKSGLPSELVSLDSILLKDQAEIEISVKLKNMPELSSPIHTVVKMDLPKMFAFNSNLVNAQNHLEFVGDFDENDSIKIPLKLKGLVFDGKPLNGTIDINEKIKYEASVSVDAPNVETTNFTGEQINVIINANLKNIGFRKVYGKLSPNIEPIDQSVSLGEIPEFLQNDSVVLDITRPIIALETNSNFGLPIRANVEATPIVKGVEKTESKQTFRLNIPKSNLPTNHIQTKFWIAPDSAGMPQDYVFVETPLQQLFKVIPDGMKLLASVESDQSVQHFFDLGATYTFKMGYDVTVPFAFGEEFKVVIENDIDGIDPKIGEMAASVKGIELLGEVINSIPLDLTLAIVPLDANNNRIAIDTVSQIIQAGTIDGSAIPSTLSLKLDDPNGLLKELRGFRLIFKAASNSTVGGAAIRPENFIKANLKIRLTGGIDISSFIEEE